MKVYAIYIPRSAIEGNLRIGLTHRVWGWRGAVLARGSAMSSARAMRPGDVVLMGMGGPNPRVDAGGWDHAELSRAIALRVTQGLHRDSSPMWPDDVYPNRVKLEYIGEQARASARHVGTGGLEALRWSANTMGAPVIVGDSGTVPFLSNL